ncbi:hypothetical protein K438DRAFT_1779121 [Mycena galopus ATCC 62051]|nr:hypothetical protein K438DRAFT_1779121 [Mycena galopus ATCC 62051]
MYASVCQNSSQWRLCKFQYDHSLSSTSFPFSYLTCKQWVWESHVMHRASTGRQKAPVFRPANLGEYHPEILGTMIHLARVYWNLGQWKCADDLQILALEKQRGLFGEENDERMMAMRDLAIIYHNQGHHKEAKKVHTSALENIGKY